MPVIDGMRRRLTEVEARLIKLEELADWTPEQLAESEHLEAERRALLEMIATARRST